MKDKALYLLMGAALMYLAMKFLQPTTIQPRIVKTNLSNEAVVLAEPVQPSAEQTTTQAAPDKQKLTAPPTLTQQTKPKDRSKQNAILRAFKMQKLKSNLAKVFANDSVKLDQVAGLANKKMERDQALQELITIDYDDAVAQAESQIMIKDDNELTAEQLEIKNTKLEQYEQYADKTEQSRQEFEDDLKNLLSNSELEAFQQQEQEFAQKSYERHLKTLDSNARINIKELNDFQASQIDDLIAKYIGETLPDVPIGSSISASPIMISGAAQERTAKLYDDLKSVLSQEQMKQLRSAPIMYDFSE